MAAFSFFGAMIADRWTMRLTLPAFAWWLLQLVDWTECCIAVTDSDVNEIWAMVADGTSIGDRAVNNERRRFQE
ncbi:hypothetical protein [Mesorhizobium sp.]|uniref:hypothetical protein n=1 Tax=Mesorhizobium sp. TaxID=1871066 RepID=UPI00121D2AD3|nr:hypothetical protein [Mesorhizobium sp.]TIX26169.1 MAG: hypothetical protein E5V35_11610 [Mesorhizobium sp.]